MQNRRVKKAAAIGLGLACGLAIGCGNASKPANPGAVNSTNYNTYFGTQSASNERISLTAFAPNWGRGLELHPTEQLQLLHLPGHWRLQLRAYVVAGGGLGQAGAGSCATIATDAAGDGCAATDAYLGLSGQQYPVINVDSQGNRYINDGTDPNSGNPLGVRVVLEHGRGSDGHQSYRRPYLYKHSRQPTSPPGSTATAICTSTTGRRSRSSISQGRCPAFLPALLPAFTP